MTSLFGYGLAFLLGCTIGAIRLKSTALIVVPFILCGVLAGVLPTLIDFAESTEFSRAAVVHGRWLANAALIVGWTAVVIQAIRQARDWFKPRRPTP